MFDPFALYNLIKGLHDLVLLSADVGRDCPDCDGCGGFEPTKSMNDYALITWSLKRSLILS